MLKATERELIAMGRDGLAQVVAGVRKDLGKDIPFPQPKEPKSAKPIVSETPRPRGVEPIGYAIDIPTVDEEVYLRTREAVEATGHTFVATIRPVSVGGLLLEDRQREQAGNPRRLGYVTDSRAMRATVPPEMEIAINPDKVRIEGSNYLSTDEQIARIREEEARWKEALPEDIRPFVGMRMVDPSTYSQLEDAYMDNGRGLLLPDYFARTDVQTVRGDVAGVGRSDPDRQRYVFGWNRDLGNHYVVAVPVVVLPQKLAS